MHDLPVSILTCLIRIWSWTFDDCFVWCKMWFYRDCIAITNTFMNPRWKNARQLPFAGILVFFSSGISNDQQFCIFTFQLSTENSTWMTMTLEGQEYFMLYLIHNKIQGISSTESDVGCYNIIRRILFLTNSDIRILTENLNTPNT